MIDVILIVHNQLELLKQNIEMLESFVGDVLSNIIIVDNASEDGLSDWLQESNMYNYILCDEGMEGYAIILNTVVKEFQLKNDILVMTPNCILISDALSEMKRVLYKNESTLAVSPSKLQYGTENGIDYISAVNYAIRCERRGDVKKLAYQI